MGRIEEEINLRKENQPMNRTKGFVNLNRFKSGRAIKRLKRVMDRYKLKRHKVFRV